MRRTTLLTLGLLAVSTLVAQPAFAKGGGGGGGGGTTPTPTVSAGSIRQVSAVAVCDSGTSLSVTLRKGFNKRVEAQIVPLAQGTNADGSLAGQSWWTQGVVNDTTGSSIGSWGGNKTMAPGLVETNLLGIVPVGTSELTYTATRKDLSAPGVIDLAAIALMPVVETCTAHFTVVAR